MLLQEQLHARANFSDTECTIADYILARGLALKQESARHVAAAVYVSPSTVVRLTQKLGFAGYGDFREAWLQEQEYLSGHFQGLDANRPFAPDDPLNIVATKIGALYSETVADTLALLDSGMLVQAVGYCCRARNIYVCSAGAQQSIAESFAEKMAKIGKTVITAPRTDLMFYHACNCTPDDCFLLISYSGQISAMLRLARKLKARRVNTVTLTSFGSNPLEGMFPCSLYLSTRERLVDNLGNFGAHLSSMFLLDVLYAAVFRQQYAENLAHKISVTHEFERERHSDNPLIQDLAEPDPKPKP